uniref:C40 family peptidase n=1 Tax=Clostridioides difficile TaxID=1496 RepID=UPI003FEF7AA2
RCGAGENSEITSKNYLSLLELVNQYLTVPQVSGELAQKVMNEALKYQGWKYVFGGSNPNTSFDCSGLVQWCYGKAGIYLPRTAQTQYDATQHIPLSQAKAGELVFFHSTYNAGSYVTHVGIYVGNNQMYHAGNQRLSNKEIAGLEC